MDDSSSSSRAPPPTGLPLLVRGRPETAGPPVADPPPRWPLPWKVGLGGVFLVLVAMALFWVLSRGAPAVPGAGSGLTDQVALDAVVSLGRLTPSGELRSLAAPFGAGDARVAELLVAEGDQVPAGAVLVRFDNAAALEAALVVAERQLAGRQAALAQTERGVSSSQAESAAAVARADVTARAAETELRRWAVLADQGFVSAAAVDQRRAVRDEALEELRRARATLARHAGEGMAQPDLQAARVAIELATAERDRALNDLSRAVIRAPTDGTVIAIHTRPGERPGNAGVLDFGNVRSMTVEVEVYQADAGRVRVGQPARIVSTALAGDLSGRVTRVGLSVGRQRLVDTSPAANVDARVIAATIELDEASSAKARGWVGLEVQVRIDVGPP